MTERGGSSGFMGAGAPGVIQRTAARCVDCGGIHPARYEIFQGAVWFVSECAGRQRWCLVSRDPELFVHFREQSLFPLEHVDSAAGVRMINLIEVTNDCNFACSFCYVSANRARAIWYRTIGEVIDIMREIRRDGCRNVTLTGGEVTLCADLPRIVRHAKRLGFVVNIASNGYLLGTDPSLARTLRRAGLDSVYLQLDTFDPEIHKLHRNNDFVAQKLLALEQCARAGLRTGVFVVVTKHNLGTLARTIEGVARYVPNCHLIALQPMMRVGESRFADDVWVCKEEIVRELARTVTWLPVEAFRPLPRFRP